MSHPSSPQSIAPPSKLQAFLFALSLAGYPLIAIFPVVFGVDTQIFTIPYRAAVLSLSLLALFFMVRSGTKLFVSKFWIAFAVFWLLYSARIAYEALFAQHDLGFAATDYVLITYGVTLIPAAIFAFPPNIWTLERARQLTFFMAVAGLIGNLATGWENIALEQAVRFNTEALNAVSVAALGSIAVLIGLSNIIADPQPTGRNVVYKTLIRTIYFLGIVLGLVTIYLSGSRGPLIATGISAMLLLWISSRENLRKAAILALIFIAITTAVLVYGETISSGALFTRLSSIATLEDQSDTTRLELWQDGTIQFLESPIVGSGLEEKNSQFYPHNIPLEAFMATGLIGGTCWLIMLVMALISALRLLKLPAQYSWIGVIFIHLSLMSLLAGSLWASASLTHLMLASMALYFASTRTASALALPPSPRRLRTFP